MKDKGKLLILFIFAIFACIPIVNAGVASGDNLECDTHIDLYEISSGDFDVDMPVCQWTRTDATEQRGTGADSYDGAWNQRKTEITVTAMSLTGKSASEIKVPLCTDDSHVEAIANCTAYTTKTTIVTDTYCKVDMGVDEDGKAIPCPSDQIGYYYGCPPVEGYTLDEAKTGYNETCSYTKTGAATKMGTVSEDVDLDAAAAACVSQHSAKSCTCSDATYGLFCPVYTCTKVTEHLNPACTDKFKIGNNIAYCVNPNDNFPEYTPAGQNNYIYDKRFDPTTCTSSNSTIDCGYANILIEGAWNHQQGYEISNTSLDFALRLWSAHNDRRGFELSGLPNAKGGSCNEFVFFLPGNDGEYTNVYKITLDYITRTYFDEITASAKYKVQELKPFFREVTCEKWGLACNGRDVLKNAFALYFNTLLGNKDMQAHLAELYGSQYGIIPTGATIEEISETEKESRIVIRFDEVSRSIETDVRIDCDKLDPNDPNYNLIEPYCKVTFTIVDGDGNILVDENGNQLTDITIDECNLKSYGCYSKKLRIAICDLAKESITPIIIVHYDKVISSRSVRKYIACANPNESQIMFAYYDKDKTERDTTVTRGETQFRVVPRCSGGTCTNFDTRVSSNFGKCSSTGSYGEVYTSYVKDPPLNCILNSKNKTSYYDYSNLFGVNTNLCRVYCSDSVEYIMPDKVKATSGKSFKYDIEFVANKQRKTDKLLSSIIREKRTCVSEIYYDNVPSEIDWKRLYGITDEEISKATSNGSKIQNFYDLLSVLVYKSADEGSRKEVINKLVYDLYNCNFYAKNKFPSNLTEPKDIDVKNVYENITKKIFSLSNNYGLNGCNIGFDNDGNFYNNCVKMSNVEYEGGAEVIGKDANIGKKTSNYDYTVTQSSNIELDSNNKPTRESTINSSVSKVKYCSGHRCFEYNEDLNGEGDNTKADVYDLDSSLFSTTSNELDSIEITKTRVINGKRKTSSIKYKVPTNDYAVFEVTTEFGFYNSDIYQTEPGSGKVQNVNKDGEITGYIYLDNYTYPISKNAYNVCTKASNGLSRCDVKQKIQNIATYKRNYPSDEFVNIVNEHKEFNCYIDVEKPTTIERDEGTIYRNVELSSLFNPTAPIDSNWLSSEGIIATGEIQESSNSLQTSDDYLEYSISLSPEQIRNIKNTYNRENGVYSSERIYNCRVEDGTYRDCQSTFLDELRRGNSENGTDTYGTISSEHSDGVSNKTKGLTE